MPDSLNELLNAGPAPRQRRAGGETVAAVVREGNCMGCGTCAAACPTGAARIVLDAGHGVYLPEVDDGICTHCGLCLAVCPGREVPIDALADRFLDGGKRHEKLGRYRSLMLGYACDERIRFDGASGGLMTALLVHALEKGFVDGVAVLGHEPDRPLLTRPYIARSREEIIAANGSKYCPAAMNLALREIRRQPGRYAVAGLPCQVHGLRKWQARDPVLRERIRYVLGLFCANENTYLGTEYFLWCNGISPAEVRSIRYRAGGWPGEIEVRTDDRTHRFRRVTTETNPRKRALLSSAFHYDFMIPRCLVCCDQTCELSDASFADPHLPEMRAKYHDGISWSIIRTKAIEELIESARMSGQVHLEPFAEEMALRAQNYAYKSAVAGRMAMWRWRGHPAPEYGRPYISTASQRRQARRYRWTFWTHIRNIWPLLRIVQAARRYSAIHPVNLSARCIRLVKRSLATMLKKTFRRHNTN